MARRGAPARIRLAGRAVPIVQSGPHIRLGLAWSALTLVAVLVGPILLALVLAPAAAAAAAQAARSWRGQRRAAWQAAAGGAGMVVFTATLGVIGVIAGVTVVILLLTLAHVLGPSAEPIARHRADPMLTGLIAVACGLAGAGPVLLRADGLIPAFVLFSFVHVYDASAYIVGSGARATWEGPAAGVASIAAVTLAIAAVLSPPFRGASPWLFGLLAALLLPLGPLLAAELTGDRRARVPALRRLDGLLVVGPIWALAVALVLD